MANTKNALIRFKYLDKLLSDRHHYYDRQALTEKVNELLRSNHFSEVVKRTIELDIEDLTFSPFNAPIEEIKKDGKRYVRYRDSSFSIFTTEISDEERNLLHEVLNTIGQFDGLNHFEWLDKFKSGLGLKKRKPIISFSNNPYLKNSNLLGTLFDDISNKVVIKLSYHTFADETIRSIVIHPYLLKQYNDRWFLLGAADTDKKILTFALDRINKVEPLPERKYEKCPEDLFERFEDIVGVTFYEDRAVEHILCWASDNSKGYIETKPINGSYTLINGEEEQQLRTQYPQLEGGLFFTLDCINNYELIRELCSYGKDLLVLQSDGNVKADVMKRIREMNEQYSKINKSNI